MRTPQIEIDGWELESGEQYHRRAPDTFEVPKTSIRTGLCPGDLAKLIFSISIDNLEQPIGVERMWVLVREVTPEGRYFGLLDNQPTLIGANNEFWLDTEVPFGPEHVIDAQLRDTDSVAAAAARTPLRSWPRA